MKKQWTFNQEIAEESGLKVAVLVSKMAEIIRLNKQLELYQYGDDYWCCYSVKEFESVFKFWSGPTIRNTLAKGVCDGWIKQERLSKIRFDRRYWYTLTEKTWKVLEED